jgi:hypothetical protein
MAAILVVAGCGAPATTGPAASPRIACQGVPAERCDEAVTSAELSLPNTVLTSIEVICVSGTCTTESGAMDTVVTLADGSQLRSSTVTWAQGLPAPGGVKPLPAPVPPAPDVPVAPQCLDVPLEMCRTMAETAFGELGKEGVVSIVVRCSDLPCTDDHGIVETVVTYGNGTVLTTDGEYAGG